LHGSREGDDLDGILAKKNSGMPDLRTTKGGEEENRAPVKRGHARHEIRGSLHGAQKKKSSLNNNIT